jgi:hypothetical protein
MHWFTRTGLLCLLSLILPTSFGLVDRLSEHLGDSTRDPAVLDRAASAQKGWAERRLHEDPGLGLVVMGHTHRPALSEPFPGRQYCNPGAWMDGMRYAVATASTVELRSWQSSTQ